MARTISNAGTQALHLRYLPSGPPMVNPNHESAAQSLLAARKRGTPGPRIPEKSRPTEISDGLMRVDPNRLEPGSIVVDIINSPEPTALCRAAQGRGCRAA
jgi:hypothetical protein